MLSNKPPSVGFEVCDPVVPSLSPSPPLPAAELCTFNVDCRDSFAGHNEIGHSEPSTRSYSNDFDSFFADCNEECHTEPQDVGQLSASNHSKSKQEQDNFASKRRKIQSTPLAASRYHSRRKHQIRQKLLKAFNRCDAASDTAPNGNVLVSKSPLVVVETDSYCNSKPNLLPKGIAEHVISASNFDSNEMLREYKATSDDVGCLETSSEHCIANAHIEHYHLQRKRMLNLCVPRDTPHEGVKRARVFHHPASPGIRMKPDVPFVSVRDSEWCRSESACGSTHPCDSVIGTNAPT